MQEEIYADVLFIINFSMDFLSLYIVGRLMHFHMKAWRVILGASLGALYGVLELLLAVSPFPKILITLGVLCLTCFIAFGGCRFHTYAASVALNFGVGMLIGGMMTILCAVLSYQTVLSRAADSVTMRAVRFTLSGTVPIIGGAVSEAASTVAAGFSLVNRTVGGLGAALLLWQMLPPICEVILLRAALSLSAALASLLGMTREADILRDCASIGGFLLAIVIAASVLYLLMLSLCIGT